MKQAGNVLEDVERILYNLFFKHWKDIERTQHGIVYIDETDNMWKYDDIISISCDMSSEGVQHALLRIVKGNGINV